MPRTTLVTRIEPDVKEQLAAVAKAQHRTSSNLVEWLIKQYLDQVANRDTSPTTDVKMDFAQADELSAILGERRPAIADTLKYLEDK